MHSGGLELTMKLIYTRLARITWYATGATGCSSQLGHAEARIFFFSPCRCAPSLFFLTCPPIYILSSILRKHVSLIWIKRKALQILYRVLFVCVRSCGHTHTKSAFCCVCLSRLSSRLVMFFLIFLTFSAFIFGWSCFCFVSTWKFIKTTWLVDSRLLTVLFRRFDPSFDSFRIIVLVLVFQVAWCMSVKSVNNKCRQPTPLRRLVTRVSYASVS